ncbi:MAG: protein translocase subunit SecF [Clostridiales bacterium]|nr:protein translocase subunit SecF [Clostridiales bacterium]
MSAILKNKWIFLGIAGVLMLASIASIAIQGFNLDSDFAGGITVTYEIKDNFDTNEISQITDTALGSDRSPGYDQNLETEADRANFSMEKVSAITKALQEKYDPENVGKNVNENANNDSAQTENTENQENQDNAAAEAKVVLKSQDIISPSTGRDLARSALWMSVLACVAILVYVTFRFEFTSGAVAVIALIHDVLVLMGIYSVLRISVDTNFIAAILTVLGYSINNTIVIMDRIRENTRHARKESYAQIADKSILETMTRSINTTVTTLLTIGMVYILGVASIQKFSLPIIIGIVIGFYSSVFCSGALWATWKDAGVKSKQTSKK